MSVSPFPSLLPRSRAISTDTYLIIPASCKLALEAALISAQSRTSIEIDSDLRSRLSRLLPAWESASAAVLHLFRTSPLNALQYVPVQRHASRYAAGVAYDASVVLLHPVALQQRGGGGSDVTSQSLSRTAVRCMRQAHEAAVAVEAALAACEGEVLPQEGGVVEVTSVGKRLRSAVAASQPRARREVEEEEEEEEESTEASSDEDFNGSEEEDESCQVEVPRKRRRGDESLDAPRSNKQVTLRARLVTFTRNARVFKVEMMSSIEALAMHLFAIAPSRYKSAQHLKMRMYFVIQYDGRRGGNVYNHDMLAAGEDDTEHHMVMYEPDPAPIDAHDAWKMWCDHENRQVTGGDARRRQLVPLTARVVRFTRDGSVWQVTEYDSLSGAVESLKSLDAGVEDVLQMCATMKRALVTHGMYLLSDKKDTTMNAEHVIVQQGSAAAPRNADEAWALLDRPKRLTTPASALQLSIALRMIVCADGGRSFSFRTFASQGAAARELASHHGSSNCDTLCVRISRALRKSLEYAHPVPIGSDDTVARILVQREADEPPASPAAAWALWHARLNPAHEV